jgi:UDP-N-acetylenolpyruvoylglucosamine reductase
MGCGSKIFFDYYKGYRCYSFVKGTRAFYDFSCSQGWLILVLRYYGNVISEVRMHSKHCNILVFHSLFHGETLFFR